MQRKTKEQIYLKIIELGILNFRMDAFAGDTKSCISEADHIHNIPSFLVKDWKEQEDWYWNTDRKCYRKEASPERLARFNPLWQELEKLRK